VDQASCNTSRLDTEDFCHGRRGYFDFTLRKHDRCLPCQQAWRHDVAWFRYALRHPQAAARRLRGQAEALRREQVERDRDSLRA
jgi:hypothetical protein